MEDVGKYISYLIACHYFDLFAFTDKTMKTEETLSPWLVMVSFSLHVALSNPNFHYIVFFTSNLVEVLPFLLFLPLYLTYL